MTSFYSRKAVPEEEGRLYVWSRHIQSECYGSINVPWRLVRGNVQTSGLPVRIVCGVFQDKSDDGKVIGFMVT